MFWGLRSEWVKMYIIEMSQPSKLMLKINFSIKYERYIVFVYSLLQLLMGDRNI